MKKGFTLIELLVVVLIIGILSAVALPQYQVAVAKARFATMQPIVTALVQAQDIYHMENGFYSSSFSDLSIDPPGGGTIRPDSSGDGENIDYKGFYCRLHNVNTNSVSVYCSGKYGYYRVEIGANNEHKRYCVVTTELNNADVFEKMCKSLGGVKDSGRSSAEWIFYLLP
ncbi:MAG: prepilin-type N-terminal cleavage/methylation domain-containing protein [Elusimicrobiaceae bacterium]|nr:prepilin-type N-terminal cleavage/methylation domain-containing protein [Elusimicrobiaceae bacterium]